MFPKHIYITDYMYIIYKFIINILSSIFLKEKTEMLHCSFHNKWLYSLTKINNNKSLNNLNNNRLNMFILKKHNAFYMFIFMAKVEINFQTKFKFSFATKLKMKVEWLQRSEWKTLDFWLSNRYIHFTLNIISVQ